MEITHNMPVIFLNVLYFTVMNFVFQECVNFQAVICRLEGSTFWKMFHVLGFQDSEFFLVWIWPVSVLL